MAQKQGDSDWASTGFHSVLPRKNLDIINTLKKDKNSLQLHAFRSRISLSQNFPLYILSQTQRLIQN